MALSAKEYYKITCTLFETHANPVDAEAMLKYMRNQFAFYGLKAPIRRAIEKEIIKEYGLPSIEQLPELLDLMWADEHRELQHFGMDILDKQIKKVDENFIAILEKLITTKSWWDTVDMIAVRLVGTLCKRFPEMVPDYPNKWMASNNRWLQRTSIIFQLKHKESTDTDLLFDYILQLKHSKEFFIQKAAGWALREYSKTDWELIHDFIEAHPDLAPLTRREGLKWMKSKGVL